MRGSEADLVTTAIVAASRFPFPQSLQKSGNCYREAHRLSRFRDHRTAWSCLDAKAELADLQAKKAVTVAELERATALLKERRAEHQEVEASLLVMRKEKAEMRRLVFDDPPRSFLEGMGRRQA